MRSEGSKSDDELLARLRAGDEAAFVTLYRRRQSALYRFAWHMSGSSSIAEDITQEIFLVLLRGECRYDSSRGRLAGYLFGIARKMVLQHMDRNRGQYSLDAAGDDSSFPELAVDADPLMDMNRKQTIEALRRAVQSLPPRYREVIILCELEELDYNDAALALGCPVGTVRSRLHRARSLLAGKLRGARDGHTAELAMASRGA